MAALHTCPLSPYAAHHMQDSNIICIKWADTHPLSMAGGWEKNMNVPHSLQHGRGSGKGPEGTAGQDVPWAFLGR